MPANPKFLNLSPWHRFAKIFSGILLGYFVSALLHMNLALWLPNSKEVLITSIYTHYILWCGLMVIPFLFRSGWKIVLVYIFCIIVLFIGYYLGNQQNPFI